MSGRALVTGGLGLVGLPLVGHLRDLDFEVVVLDHAEGTVPAPGVRVVRGDVRRHAGAG